MLASQWYFLFNILMSFNELCDLKNLKKLISGSCLTPIIQSYINNFKNIYIYEHDLHKMHYGMHIFLLIYFTIYNYLLFFESDHIWFQHHFIHMCVHPSIVFTIFKNWKTKDTLLNRMRHCVGCAFLRNFWMSCFEVVCRFSKCKF